MRSSRTIDLLGTRKTWAKLLRVGPQLVDPRVVYQLVLFAQQRGAAQFQGEQLLKVLDAFEDCQIADSKAWARLG